MEVAFQVVLLIAIVLSMLGAFAEDEIKTKQTLASVCIAAMFAFIITLILF